MTDRKPTINDVAARSGVSLGTVSNVLNGSIPVSKDLRERVFNAIQQLGYTQNRLAQGLRSKRTLIVGLCVPHTAVSYFSALVDAFEEVGSSAGFEIMQVLSRQDPDKEYSRIKSLLKYRVGGLILVPSLNADATYNLIAASKVPTVVVDRAPTGRFPFDRVSFNNPLAMRQVTEGLLQRGYRNILFLFQHRQLNITIARAKSLEDTAKSFSDDVVTTVLESHDESTLTAQLAADMRKWTRPTAIIASNSRIAAWVLRAFRVLKLNCPRDVSLVAFDEPEWADIVMPSLSAVRQPTQKIATMAWQLLMQRMSNEAGEPQEIQLEAEVVFRNSVRDLRLYTEGSAMADAS